MKLNTLLPGIPILIAILIVASAGYLYWVQTPQYSMIELAEAVHKHDGAEFQKYFDTNSVANNAINDLTAEELRQVGGHRLLRSLLGATILGTLNPQMSASLAKSINDFVTKTPEEAAAETAQKQQAEELARQKEGPLGRIVDGFVHKVVDAIKPPPLKEVLKEMGLTKENFVGLTDFTTEQGLCHVGMLFRNPQDNNKTIKVMLELENRDKHWYVTRIANMDELARILTASTSQ